MKIFCRSKINMKDKHKMHALFLYDQKTNPVHNALVFRRMYSNRLFLHKYLLEISSLTSDRSLSETTQRLATCIVRVAQSRGSPAEQSYCSTRLYALAISGAYITGHL